jgi:hypothetical protein
MIRPLQRQTGRLRQPRIDTEKLNFRNTSSERLKKRDELVSAMPASDLLGQETVKELHRNRTQLAEALLEQQRALARVVGGVMALD